MQNELKLLKPYNVFHMQKYIITINYISMVLLPYYIAEKKQTYTELVLKHCWKTN